MKFEGTEVWGFTNALRGMRLPMAKNYEETCIKSKSLKNKNGEFIIDPDDLRVATNRTKADSAFCGQPESKFLRMIHLQVAITAPMYWWSEMDTYKVGTVANSTSKMHKLASTPITRDCFEVGDFEDVCIPMLTHNNVQYYWDIVIGVLEQLRQKYNETKDKQYWKELLRFLPNSWLQTRMWDANYEVLRNIYSQRKHHRLTEWSVDFCNWVKSLPYSKELITDGE